MKFDSRGRMVIVARRKGFTLVQILLVVSILSMLATVLFGTFTRGRAAVRRAECDVHMKGVSLALETFLQDHRRLPKNLGELTDEKYLNAAVLRCPADPTLASHAGDLSYSSYGDYYIIREPRDSGELPILVCPFHEGDGSYGEQAYKGGYTKQFAAKPTILTGDNVSGAVTVSRPGQGFLTVPRPGSPALELRGGDRIKTGAGTAKLRFADGSEATIDPNSELSVLQSYVEGRQRGPLYTLVRQFSGRVNYYVSPGNRFDVATPTATAGALGTRFIIEIIPSANGPAETKLTVLEHVVALTTLNRTIEVTANEPPIEPDAPAAENKPRKPRTRGLIGGLLDLLDGDD